MTTSNRTNLARNVIHVLFMLALMVMSLSAFAQGGGDDMGLGDMRVNKIFCSVAGVLQSKWAPGILLIVIVIEGILYVVAKKGILEKLMIVVLAATVIFGAATVLKIIAPSASCGNQVTFNATPGAYQSHSNLA